MRLIILNGEPKSTQHIYHYACRGSFPTMYMTPAGRALKTQYQWEAKSQWRGAPHESDVNVSITLYFGTKRRADLDNFNKLILDALTGIAYNDDSQICNLHIGRAFDKEAPRAEVAIWGDNGDAPIDATSDKIHF